MIVFEKKHGSCPARVGDPIAVGRTAKYAAGDLAVMLLLDAREYRLDREERQPQSPRELGPGQLAGKVQRLEGELRDQIVAEPSLVERLGRLQPDTGVGFSGQHLSAPRRLQPVPVWPVAWPARMMAAPRLA